MKNVLTIVWYAKQKNIKEWPTPSLSQVWLRRILAFYIYISTINLFMHIAVFQGEKDYWEKNIYVKRGQVFTKEYMILQSHSNTISSWGVCLLRHAAGTVGLDLICFYPFELLSQQWKLKRQIGIFILVTIFEKRKLYIYVWTWFLDPLIALYNSGFMVLGF